jgi:hypothetical protein
MGTVAYIRHKKPRPKRRGDGQGQDLYTYAAATTPAAHESADRLPMTPTTAPVSAATEQQNDYDDDEKQFHGKTPLMVLALFARHCIFSIRQKHLAPSLQPCWPCLCSIAWHWAFYQTAADPGIVRATAISH